MAELPTLDVFEVAAAVNAAGPPEPGPFISGFAAWLDTGHGLAGARLRHLRDVKEFLSWYDVNAQDDVVSAARQFAEYGSHQQATSMRLLLEWLAGG